MVPFGKQQEILRDLSTSSAGELSGSRWETVDENGVVVNTNEKSACVHPPNRAEIPVSTNTRGEPPGSVCRIAGAVCRTAGVCRKLHPSGPLVSARSSAGICRGAATARRPLLTWPGRTAQLYPGRAMVSPRRGARQRQSSIPAWTPLRCGPRHRARLHAISILDPQGRRARTRRCGARSQPPRLPRPLGQTRHA